MDRIHPSRRVDRARFSARLENMLSISLEDLVSIIGHLQYKVTSLDIESALRRRMAVMHHTRYKIIVRTVEDQEV